MTGDRLPSLPSRSSTADHTGGVRLLDVLDALTSMERPVALTELAQRLGLPKSTIHRLLATLKRARYVRQDAATERYDLGVKALRLGVVALQTSSLLQAAHPHMERLAQQVGETVQLSVRDDDKVMPLHFAESDVHVIRASIPKGAYTPLHATASGKVLLSGLMSSELDRLVDRMDLRAFTPHTITDRSAFKHAVAEARARGYGTDREEHNLGVCCVAVPIRDHQDGVAASLSVTAPASRLPLSRVPELAAQVRAAADEVAVRMHAQPRSQFGRSE